MYKSGKEGSQRTQRGNEGYRRLRAPCIAQGRRCGRCGSQGHLARVCIKEMNLHMERGKSRTKCKKTTPKEGRHQTGGAGMQTQDTRPAQANRSSWKRMRIRRDQHASTKEPKTRTPDLSMVTRQRTVNPTNSSAAVPEHVGTNNKGAGANAQQDMARWTKHLAEAMQNPAFPLFMSMAFGNRGFR